jgi:cephalosporin-C deacetylase-like acetyl esterase
MKHERLAIFGAMAGVFLSAQTVEPRQQLIGYLDGIANTQLAARRETVARIATRAAAEQRREMVRRKIVELIGGLPESRGPVVVKSFGAVPGDGFRVEKLAFESLPGFWVTANVYVPTGRQGPFPAIVLTPGHEASGKSEQYAFGVNFARMGILALAYDPIGQGERLQYFDPATKASKVGGATAEHGEANLPTLLIGDDLERYMVHDGMRAIDYLTSRPDVDRAHIGALGCSGGGTATAVLAALDERVQAAGTACYITSFEQMLPSATGVQEAEQSIPHFIEAGLDFADWVEAAAPRAYAIISTTADMFPFDGARQSYQEAERIYGLYGAAERLEWITGPGGHGNLGPISPAILGFFARHLQGDATPQQMAPARPANVDDLRCTPTGQVSTSLGGETVWSLDRKRAGEIVAQRPAPDPARLRAELRTLAGISWQPGSPAPAMAKAAVEQRDGWRIDSASLPSATGVDLGVKIAVPDRGGRMPAVLWMDSQAAAIGPDAERLAKSGSVVMAMAAQPWPPGTESVKSPYLGSFNLLSLRAFLVGRTLVGIRADDALRALDWLRARSDVDASRLTIYGNGALGMAALDAAVLDTRIARVVEENSLSSYRSIVDVPLHRNVSEVVIPGVLRQFDVADLLRALAPRPAVVVDPVDGAGAPVSEAEFRQSLGTAGNVSIRARQAANR